MGGRGSMMKTSLLLGGGESRMFYHQVKHRRLGLGIGNFTADQLFSLLREVDDGALAAPNHCLRCTMRFAGACWGAGLALSLEESGPIIKFTDMLEVYRDRQFFTVMYHKNSPLPPKYNKPLTRFTPYDENLDCKRYLKTLVGGTLHRAYQIYGDGNPREISYALWELLRELHDAPLHYPVKELRVVTFGFRAEWARPILSGTRSSLDLIVHYEQMNT